MLILTHEDVASVVGRVGADAFMDLLIGRLRHALARAGEYDQRVRDGFCWTAPEGLVEWMPVKRRGGDVHIKLVSYVPGNPARGLPTIQGGVACVNADSGQIVALADACLATALRTGAASAVATDVLACEGAETLGLIGCGAQAVTQAHGVCRVRPIRRALVYDTCEDAAASFARRADWLGIEVTRAGLETIVARADVLCTATSVTVGGGPVFSDGPFRAELHINAVGSDFPGKFEVPRAMLEQAFVVPDLRGQAVREGECQRLRAEQIGPELAQLIANPDEYREQRARLTVFDSTGMALEDAVAMELLVSLARELGLGSYLETEPRVVDPRDPYESLRHLASQGRASS